MNYANVNVTCATRGTDTGVIAHAVYTRGSPETPVSDAVVDVGQAVVACPACKASRGQLDVNRLSTSLSANTQQALDLEAMFMIDASVKDQDFVQQNLLLESCYARVK